MQRPPDEFGGGIIGREMAFVANAFSHAPMQALARVSDVDDPARRRREREERNDVLSIATPAPCDDWKALAPRPTFELVQRVLSDLDVVDWFHGPQRQRECFSLLTRGPLQ